MQCCRWTCSIPALTHSSYCTSHYLYCILESTKYTILQCLLSPSYAYSLHPKNVTHTSYTHTGHIYNTVRYLAHTGRRYFCNCLLFYHGANIENKTTSTIVYCLRSVWRPRQEESIGRLWCSAGQGILSVAADRYKATVVSHPSVPDFLREINATPSPLPNPTSMQLLNTRTSTNLTWREKHASHATNKHSVQPVCNPRPFLVYSITGQRIIELGPPQCVQEHQTDSIAATCYDGGSTWAKQIKITTLHYRIFRSSK